MNISESERDLASYVSMMEQLEQQQKVLKKYLIAFKRELDSLTERFNHRPEIQQLESLNEEILALHERFNQLPTLSNSLDSADTIDAAVKEANIDNSEIVKQFFERVEQQQSQKGLVDADAAETEEVEEINAVLQERRVSNFSNEEFKVERMMMLLDRIYAAQEETAISVEELLRRYKAGEKDFSWVNLLGTNYSQSRRTS